MLAAIDDSYALRAGGMVLASLLLTAYTAIGTVWFMAGDKELTLAKVLEDLRTLPEISGGILPALIRHNAEYFTPGFHPDAKDNYYMAENKLRELGMRQAS